ncbi:Brevis radix (BRX) domain [Dillenia turbinata]|uniref:Brevis radix (BRX) domain n=1 Tax=Dillenia turbinata TaxID=194707 RepID=A0AAN8VW54_9MAGN
MLTCLARPKQIGDDSLNQTRRSDSSDAPISTSKPPMKALTSQIKEMALNCGQCSGSVQKRMEHMIGADSGSRSSERFRWSYRRTGSGSSSSTPQSGSRRVETVVFVEEEEPKDWVAHVEPGVLIDFVSLPRGGNELKKIRFSREMYDKAQAQRWWTENYDRVMELYNVRTTNYQPFPLPTPRVSEDEISKAESAENSPATPALVREHLPRLYGRMGMGYSSGDSLDHHPSTPNFSSSSVRKTDTSSMDASMRASSAREVDHSGELSVSTASDLETEWVEQDEPGVARDMR